MLSITQSHQRYDARDGRKTHNGPILELTVGSVCRRISYSSAHGPKEIFRLSFFVGYTDRAFRVRLLVC
jgi:hypothetical protein